MNRQRISEDAQEEDCYAQCVAGEPRVAIEEPGEDLVVILWESSLSGRGSVRGGHGIAQHGIARDQMVP